MASIKELFKLAGTITVDSSGAVKEIDKATDAAKQSESKFEKSFQTIKNLAVTYLSTTAIWNFGKSMVEAAANVQAETAQFEAAFKDLSGSATEAFARLEESTGTLSTRLQVTGTKAFSQFTGSGMKSADALEKMEQYLGLATDGAAYYDMSLEEVDERLRSFLRGNTEAGDAIGLFTSETQRNEKALEMYGDKFIDLTEAQKQLVMLDITKSIYDASGATGQAARESEGYANVVANLKEQWRQFLAEAGAPVLQAVIPILQMLGGALQSLAPILTSITTFLVEQKDVVVALGIALLSGVAAYGLIKGAIAAYNAITLVSSTITRTYTAVTRAMSIANVQATTTTKLLTTAQRLLNAAFKANPIGIVITIIMALVAAFVVLWKKCEGFRNFWKKIWAEISSTAKNVWKEIKKVWDKVAPFFKALWESIKISAKVAWTIIKTYFGAAWEGIKAVWKNAKAFFTMVWNQIKGVFKVVKGVLTGDFKGAWEGVKQIFGSVGTFFKTVVNNIVNAFKGIGKKIWNNFSGVFGDIKNGIKNIGSNIGSGVKNLLGFSNGGVFSNESAIRVAEYSGATTNPEIVTPQNIMRDTFADTLSDYALATSGGDNSRIVELLEEYLPTIAKLRVILDTGAIVGELTDKMDRSLGERSQRKDRGRV